MIGIRQAPETTRVGRESEVTTPTLTAIIGALATDALTIAAWAFTMIMLLWKRGWDAAWFWAFEWWGAWVGGMIVPWMVFPGLLAFSFAVQTIDKHWPPTRKQREAWDGIFSGIFKREPQPYMTTTDEPVYEKTTPTIRVEVKENKNTITIGNIPDTPKMRTFAHSLLNGLPFSKAQSKMSRKDWLCVRDEFLDRGWVRWKNPRAHRQGLKLRNTGYTALLGYVDA